MCAIVACFGLMNILSPTFHTMDVQKQSIWLLLTIVGMTVGVFVFAMIFDSLEKKINPKKKEEKQENNSSTKEEVKPITQEKEKEKEKQATIGKEKMQKKAIENIFTQMDELFANVEGSISQKTVYINEGTKINIGSWDSQDENGKIEAVECKNCGATNKYVVGEENRCEYCKTLLSRNKISQKK